MEIAKPLASWIAKHFAQTAAAISALAPILRIFHDLIDEVAEVQHEAHLLRAWASDVFVHHAPIGVERADGWVLAADKRKAHRAFVVRSRRGQRAANAARIARLVHEAIPILARGSKPRRQKSASPVGRCAHLDIATRYDARERNAATDLHHQPMRSRALIGCAARPQDNAIRSGIAGSNPLRVEIAPLRANGDRLMRTASAKRERSTKGGSLRQ